MQPEVLFLVDGFSDELRIQGCVPGDLKLIRLVIKASGAINIATIIINGFVNNFS